MARNPHHARAARRRRLALAARPPAAPRVRHHRDAWEPPTDPAAGLSRLFRTSCTACGHTDLEWAGLAEALELYGSPYLDQLATALGLSTADDWEHLEVWRCCRCGEQGAFGPTMGA